MIFTDKDKEDFKNDTMCCICDGVLSIKRARDHCHITEKYRGATHPSCNLKFKIQNKISLVFHNLKGYDSHLIMQISGNLKKRKLNVSRTICKNLYLLVWEIYNLQTPYNF